MADDLEALDTFIAARQPLLDEFEEIVRAALRDDPECGDMRIGPIGPIVYDLAAGTIRPSMSGVPRGRQEDPRGEHYWMPDRPTLVRLAGRYIEYRSRRWDPKTQTVRPHNDGWLDELRRSRPGLECEIRIYEGWSDLVAAALDIIDERRTADVKYWQIKEKIGELRVLTRSEDPSVWDLAQTATWLSTVICERCGRPGELRVTESWYATRCDQHIGRSA